MSVSLPLPLDDSNKKAGAFSSLSLLELGTGDLGGKCVLFLRMLSSKSAGRVVLVLGPGGEDFGVVEGSVDLGVVPDTGDEDEDLAPHQPQCF